MSGWITCGVFWALLFAALWFLWITRDDNKLPSDRDC